MSKSLGGLYEGESEDPENLKDWDCQRILWSEHGLRVWKSKNLRCWESETLKIWKFQLQELSLPAQNGMTLGIASPDLPFL